MTTLTTPVVEKIEMSEKTVQVGFHCTLASVPVFITGTYFINSNGFYPDSISGESIEKVCEDMGWDSSETELAIQEAFENR